uniref:PINc domain-containing protein n=1 Tax=Anisakis simplex TaxID=6269 RepID=A0A0M3KBB3_ANISI
LDERFGLTTASGMNAQHKEKEIYKGEKPHEVWISSDGKRTNRDDNDMVDSSNAFDFENDSIVKLYRRTVPYLLHTSGLLITKIGMEQFESESERALLQLQALISRDECPMSAVQVVQICALYIFAVHNCSSISVEMNTCSLLQQRAVQMVLSLFAILLTCLDEFKHDLNLILIGEKPIPSKMRRVMPALWVLSEWLSTPSINRLYKGMPSLGPIESNLFQIDVWHTLASVSNALVYAESEGVLARNVPGSKDGSEVDNDKQIEITLPECVYLASFGMLLALHARASSILTAAEYLDGSGLHCFSFDEHLDRFISSCDDKRTERDMSTSKFDDRISSDIQEVADDERDRVVIEVRPNYLVPDTNAFIDHLESIQRIVDNGRYTVLVPTTVASELSCLSKPAATRPAMGSAAQMGQSIQFVSMDQEDEQENWVMERARSAVAFLKKASEQKTGHIATVTSKGSRLPSVFFGAEQCSSSSINDKTVNDDMILSSCSALSSLLPNPLSASTESATIKPSRLYRSVVLLTDDRALSIKAICANIPCRTIASFLKWAIIQ